jgi:hypothetical protein
MLGNSLKYVFRKADSGDQFDDLLQASDGSNDWAAPTAGNRN